MLTEQEKQIMDRAKASGKTFEQAMGEIAMSRKSMGTAVFDDERPLSNKITDVLGLGNAVDVFGTEIARAFAPTETRGYIEPNKPGQLLGATLQTAAIPLGAALTGGTSLAGQMAAGATAGYLYDVGSDLAENKSVTEALTPGMGTATGLLVPPALKGVVGAGNIIAGAGKTAIGAAKTAFPGVTQTVTEGLERFPRAIGKGTEALGEAALRSERIRTATPAVQGAIKSGLDDVVIDAVSNADEPTRQAYRKMVEIAEAPREGLRPAVRPESVAGDAVAEQYKILNTQRQTIGQQIGDAVDKLSTKGAVDVLSSQRTMRDLLRQNGILPDVSGKLNFSGSSLTPKQQTLVQQIYEISTQSEKMTPRQIYNMDKLFSQLQREARFDGLDNVYLKTPEGDVNVYRLFRNIFSNQLDTIAPEIAPLNKQYAQLRNLQDDIEASIVKRGNFESTRNVDAAEFAQTNLRRAFSDAASAADYRALADKLDAYARANGYTGANALDLAGFATRLRQIYPETVPETSGTGILSGGIKGILGKIMDIGAPDTIDKQRALKALLEEAEGTTPNHKLVPESVSSSNDTTKTKRSLANNPQGGFIKNPFVREEIENTPDVNPRGIDLTKEAELLVSKFGFEQRADVPGIELLRTYIAKEPGWTNITRTELAKAVKRVKDSLSSKTQIGTSGGFANKELYHGTAKGNVFDTFDTSKAGMGNGNNAFHQGDVIYLTDSKDAGKYFSVQATRNAKLRDRNLSLEEATGGKDTPGEVLSVSLKPSAKVKVLNVRPNREEIESLKSQGWDAVAFPEEAFNSKELAGTSVSGLKSNTIAVLNKDSIIWKKANGKK